jgi:2-dehydro-3-deoxyglucarate aldolase/4-hydroxy-2-oxoheptanedioate aldolase
LHNLPQGKEFQAVIADSGETIMNKFRQRLLGHEKLFGMEVDLCDPCISEMIALQGFDFIWIDTEHEAIDYHTVLLHIIAAHSGGAASLVRIPWNEPYLAKRVLEMGPDGIIFPMVNTYEEAKKAIDSCLYPPLGSRGFGPRRAVGYDGDNNNAYIADFPNSFCRFIQIEHFNAVRDMEKMAAIPYLDGFILGPCDLSGSIGRLNDIYCPETLELIDAAIVTAKKTGKPIGTAYGGMTEKEHRWWFERGIDFISAGSDIGAIVSRAKENCQNMRSAIS